MSAQQISDHAATRSRRSRGAGQHRRRHGRVARLSALLVAGGTAVTLGAGAATAGAVTPAVAQPAAAVAAAGRTYTFAPGANAGVRLMTVMKMLRAGDTLRIAPGVYGLGLVRPDLRYARGTPANPVRILAADPHHPPTLVGAFVFDQADWWQFSSLRFQGNIAGRDTLTMDSGVGWRVADSEIYGASATGAFANVVVTAINSGAGTRPVPTRWQIIGNCIHDAGTGPAAKAGQLHQIYVNAVGDTRRGLIARNIFLNTPDGAAVKLGNGGLVNAPGPQNVQVANNTIFRTSLGVLMHARVTGNVVRGNLVVAPTYRLNNGRSVGIYLHQLTRGAAGTPPNRIQQNYFAYASIPVFNQASAAGTFVDGGDNGNRANPVLHQGGCHSWAPATPAARAYGRYSATSYYTLP